MVARRPALRRGAAPHQARLCLRAGACLVVLSLLQACQPVQGQEGGSTGGDSSLASSLPPSPSSPPAPAPAAASGGLSSAAIAGIAAAGAVVATLALAGVAVLLWRWRRPRGTPSGAAPHDKRRPKNRRPGDSAHNAELSGGSANLEAGPSERQQAPVPTRLPLGTPEQKPQEVGVISCPAPAGQSGGLGRRASCDAEEAAVELLRPSLLEAMDYVDIEMVRTSSNTEGSSTSMLMVASLNVSTGSGRSTPPLSPLLHAEATQWDQVLVPFHAVEFCHDAHGALVEMHAGPRGSYKAVLHKTTACTCEAIMLGSEHSVPVFLEEVHVLWKARHPNVVQLLAASVSEDQRAGLLLTEVVAADLAGRLSIKANKGSRLFSWYHQGRRILREVAMGLAHLHLQGIAHLQLASHTVYLSRDGSAKLGRWCFEWERGQGLNLSEQDGAMAYAAPEVLAGRRPTEKADIYSYGVLMHEVLTGEPPRRGALRPLVTPADCLPEVALLFHRCLSQEQQLRPSAAEIVGTLRECSRRWAGEETGAWAPGAAPQPQRPLADVSQMRVVRRVSLARGVMLSPLATPPATGGGGSPFAPSK